LSWPETSKLEQANKLITICTTVFSGTAEVVLGHG